MNSRRAFTLIELLVVIVIIGLLAALLLPAFNLAKNKAAQTTCRNNQRQISLGLRMYCDDSDDKSPKAPGDTAFWSASWNNYRVLINKYVGLNGPPSPRDKLFACPADTFYVDLRHVNGSVSFGAFHTNAALHEQTNFDYSSYAFNGGINSSFPMYTNIIGIGGRKLSSIKDPVKTVLLAEVPAFFPYSWHQPGNPYTFGAITFNNGAVLFVDAKNMLAFVDGHVGYTRIYWNPSPTQPGVWAIAYQYDPPAGYDYKWSAD